MGLLDMIQPVLFKNGQDSEGSLQSDLHKCHKYFIMALK